MVYVLMDYNCSIPECDAAPIKLSITPLVAKNSGQWVEKGDLASLRKTLAEQAPLALGEFDAMAIELQKQNPERFYR
jgi:hypothetical protein